MGAFGKFAYSSGRWVGETPTGSPSLVVDIHDSDIATVDYEPSGSAGGRFYLGTEPRIYFDDPAASAHVERAVEARAFAEWIQQVTGRDVSAEVIAGLMASADSEAEPVDVFVEDTVQALLVLAGLPLPGGLTGEAQCSAEEAKIAKRQSWLRSR